MGKRNCFAPVTFARSGGAASVRPFSPFDGDNQGGICCFPLEKARIRAAFRESRSVFQLHRMLRYFTFSRPLSGFSSHFCNTHFRDTWFSSLPLFSNYSTGFRICESSKYHSKQFFYSGFAFLGKIRNLTVFSRNPRTPIIPQSVRLRRGADGSFVPKKRLSCRCPAARPVRPAHPAQNFPETKKIICPAHAAHVGHMMGGLVQSFPRELLPPLRELLPPLRRSPSLEEGGLWGREAEVGRISAGARCAPLQRRGKLQL